MRASPGRGVAARQFSLWVVLACSAWVACASVFIPARAAANDLPQDRLRIRIAERGIFELTHDDLRAAGVPVLDAGFDPRTLRLVFDGWRPAPLFADSLPSSWQREYEMDEVAVWVSGEDDGRFDSEDRVVFYALGPAGWVDHAEPADSLAFFEHPYDRFEYGWLVWGGAVGLRMETRSASAPEPLADPLLTRVGYREHHEVDQTFVPIGDLWAWQRLRMDITASVDFELDLGGDSTATGAIHILLGSLNSPSGRFTLQLNGIELGTVPDVAANAVTRFTFAPAPLRDQNTLTIARSDPRSTAFLFEFDTTWNRPLASDVHGELGWSARPQTAQQVYELQGFGATAPFVFDVTDPRRPVRLIDLTFITESVRWRVRHGLGADVVAHYWAADSPRRVNPETDLTMRQVSPLRSRTSSPDMLIVTHPDLLEAAERLAAHRRTHFPGTGTGDVLVATTRDIYENFSGGRQDPLAIRNYVKFLYGLSAEPRLAYLLLFGDGTQDPRQILPPSLPTLVPAVHPSLADARARRAYAVEDWFGAMHSPKIAGLYSPQADLAVGRLPARDLSEANRMVDKILAYERNSSFAPWRGRVLMAADDECSPSVGCSETYFTHNAEHLARQIPAELDVRKTYMTEYPLVGTQKPAARAALLQAWQEGCALVSFVGHGNASQLADEVLLLASDVAGLTNGARLPFVLTLHDDGGDFDRTTSQTYLEQLVAAPDGGAIAAIGATTFTFVGLGHALANQQFAELFRAGATTQQSIGLVHRLAKGAAPHFEQFILLGDPALTLQLPRASMTFTSGFDSLQTGRRARIQGIVNAAGSPHPLTDFNGTAEIEVLGNADESGYQRSEPPLLEIPYVLPGTPIYRGQVEVVAGRFAFEFTVPTVLDADSTKTKSTLLGPGARIAAYAWNSNLDAKGGRDGIVLTKGSAHDSSLTAPNIRLSFPQAATRVAAGATLTAEIEDENGIWIAGTTPESTIRVQWDGDAPIDVTPSYRSTGDSDASGTVSIPLPALALGPHRAVVFATDNLGNASSASLDFEIIDSPISHLSAVRAAPNPTVGGSDFAFLLDVPTEIELRIFSVDGREVFRIHQHHDGMRRGLVRWNGRSNSGHEVTSGVYLYKMAARGVGSPNQEATGKITVLR